MSVLYTLKNGAKIVMGLTLKPFVYHVAVMLVFFYKAILLVDLPFFPCVYQIILCYKIFILITAGLQRLPLKKKFIIGYSFFMKKKMANGLVTF